MLPIQGAWVWFLHGQIKFKKKERKKNDLDKAFLGFPRWTHSETNRRCVRGRYYLHAHISMVHTIHSILVPGGPGAWGYQLQKWPSTNDQGTWCRKPQPCHPWGEQWHPESPSKTKLQPPSVETRWQHPVPAPTATWACCQNHHPNQLLKHKPGLILRKTPAQTVSNINTQTKKKWALNLFVSKFKNY